MYSNWSNAFGENFQPIIIIDDKITFNQSLLLEWENNEKLQTFCFQGGKWNEQWIKWGDKIVLKEDKDIYLFTKELLSLMGDQSQVRFDLNVTTSNEEEEEYTVIIKFEKEKKTLLSHTIHFLTMKTKKILEEKCIIKNLAIVKNGVLTIFKSIKSC